VTARQADGREREGEGEGEGGEGREERKKAGKIKFSRTRKDKAEGARTS
jgi:hypothetical protein